ncbi:MAG TPA: ABC transporter permease [Firmicutes bacterium]|nr:ABC transporter permease [Bacillota bacterium]
MNATRQIMMWEIMRNLRNKQFLIGMFLTPLIIVGFSGLPILVQKFDRPSIDLYVVRDEVGVFPALVALAEGSNVELELYMGEDLASYAQEQKAKGYFVLDDTFVETGQVQVHVEKAQSLDPLPRLLTDLLQSVRIQQAGIDPVLVQYLTASCQVIPVLPAGKETEQLRSIVTSIALTMVMFVLILLTGGMLFYSALQEKRDRMSEVVLSSISPIDLMQGKILGNFILGVIQFAFWLILAVAVLRFGFDIPVEEYISWRQLPVLMVFGLLGYLLYGAMFVGLGATLEDVQSAGNTQGIAFMLPMLGFVFIGPIIANPDGPIATIVSLVPITSPWMVMMRSGLTVIPPWELVLSAVLLLITTILVVYASAKIFRVGMLMYGKTATPREIWKWIRYE